MPWCSSISACRARTASPASPDFGLPRKDGFAVLDGLRRRKNRLPVLILTARDAVTDRVKGLDLGADDYLVKPFSLDELAARLRAGMRRTAGRAEPLVSYGGLTLDPSARKVTSRGRQVSLSSREFSLLE